MRYQYGMSVGHTYMHGPDFPSAVIPSIPQDFDHCLDHEAAIRARILAEITVASDPSSILLPGGDATCDADEEGLTPARHDPAEAVDTPGSLPGSSGEMETMHGLGSVPESNEGESEEENEEESEEESEEEEVDYFDDQNDWELDAYNDMEVEQDHFME